MCGLSPWRSVVTEGHRAWARRFFNPYEFYITMFNEEKGRGYTDPPCGPLPRTPLVSIPTGVLHPVNGSPRRFGRQLILLVPRNSATDFNRGSRFATWRLLPRYLSCIADAVILSFPSLSISISLQYILNCQWSRSGQGQEAAGAAGEVQDQVHGPRG